MKVQCLLGRGEGWLLRLWSTTVGGGVGELLVGNAGRGPHFRVHSDPEAWPGAQQSQLLRWWWCFYNNMNFWGYPIQVVGVPAWDNAKLRGGSSCLTPWSSLSPKSVEVPIFPGPPRGCKATPECPSFVLEDAWPAPAVSQKDRLVVKTCICPSHILGLLGRQTVFPGVNRPPGSQL